jgi:hypothetical protein
VSQHEEVFQALLTLEGHLVAGDALAADEGTDEVLTLLSRTTNPAADVRLRPLFVRCQELAIELKAKLAAQLRETATSHRATQAYGREAEAMP